jgi:hypothetical protein
MSAKNVMLFPIRVLLATTYIFLRFGLILVIAFLLLVRIPVKTATESD